MMMKKIVIKDGKKGFITLPYKEDKTRAGSMKMRFKNKEQEAQEFTNDEDVSLFKSLI